MLLTTKIVLMISNTIHPHEIIEDALCYGANRFIESGRAWLRRCDEWLGIDESQIRADRYDEIMTLEIIEKKIAANSLDFYAINAARARLIQKEILQKKARGGWKINRKKQKELIT